MPAAKQIEFGGHALVWVGDWSPTSARAAISSAAPDPVLLAHPFSARLRASA